MSVFFNDSIVYSKILGIYGLTRLTTSLLICTKIDNNFNLYNDCFCNNYYVMSIMPVYYNWRFNTYGWGNLIRVMNNLIIMLQCSYDWLVTSTAYKIFKKSSSSISNNIKSLLFYLLDISIAYVKASIKRVS